MRTRVKENLMVSLNTPKLLQLGKMVVRFPHQERALLGLLSESLLFRRYCACHNMTLPIFGG